MALEEYRSKRDFKRTPEPAGETAAAPGARFVVQKHAARRLHYDFRLELDGVLKSWAVTRGPSLDPADKRLAVQVEDHPLEYGDFEGVIPKGEYGGGAVALWDRGTWEPLADPVTGMGKGVLKFRLHGQKLNGVWALVQLKAEPRNWLLIKERDAEARPGSDILGEQPTSVLSGRQVEEVATIPPAPMSAKVPGARVAPMPDQLELQLCTLVDDAPSGPDWVHEIKYDGYRMLCRIHGGQVRMLTRNGHDWTARFFPIATALRGLPCREAILDGEVVVLDTSGASDFAALQDALSTNRPQDMSLFAFDLLYLDGYDLTHARLDDRKAALARLLAGVPAPIYYSDHIEGRGPDFAAKACSFALEGVVSKRRDRPYRPGRSGDWVKAKCTSRQEFVIVGFTPSTTRGNGFGALLLGYWHDGELRYAGKVGTGFSERMQTLLQERLKAIQRAEPALADPPAKERATWVAPQLVAEVEFAEWTRDGRLRHPSFQGLREDKAVDSVVRESDRQTASVPLPAGVRLTHPDRLLWPDEGITKQALAEHYALVAPLVLPHVSGRPLSLLRCPDGVGTECFFQRHARPGMAASIKQADIPGEAASVWLDSVEGLVGLVQMGVLEIHAWGSRVVDVMHPDRLCFDLDPDPDLPWQRVVEAARDIRARLQGLGLQSFLKTTGGKGLHLVVPIEPEHSWAEAKVFCKSFADQLVRDRPDRYVATISKARRAGKILVDYLRNQFSATWVAPYSTRARAGAPVSVPLSWEELDSGLRSDHYRVTTIARRLAAQTVDPWEGIAQVRQHMPKCI